MQALPRFATTTKPSLRLSRLAWLPLAAGCLTMAALSVPDAAAAAPAAQVAPPASAQPMDLSGTVAVVATFQSRDNFTNEYRYHITVRNLGADPLIGESLTLVLDRVTNVGGDDREALKSETLLSRMEILDADGQTEDGKPYFRIATDGTADLMPRADSLPVVVRLRNRDYVQVFTPVFRVVGARRPPPIAAIGEPLNTVGAPASAPATAPAAGKAASRKPALDKLIQLLIKKGVLTEAEWRAANAPAPER